MNKQKFKWTLALLGFVLTGCASLPIATGPDIYSLARIQGAPTIVVPKVVDNRADKERVGTIGLAGFSTKADIAQALTNRVAASLHGDGYNFSGAPVIVPTNSEAVKMEVARNQAQGLLYISLEEVRLFSMDAILQPTEVTVKTRVMFFNKNGKVLFERPFEAVASKTIGLATQGSVGHLVEQALNRSVESLIADQDFRNILEGLSRA